MKHENHSDADKNHSEIDKNYMRYEAWHTCINPLCGDDVSPLRWELGHFFCHTCGEQQAKQARKKWCVIQEYSKGGYMLVTADAARTTLKQTNQKHLRD